MAIAARRQKELDLTEGMILAKCPGGKVLKVVTDVTQRGDVLELVSATEAALGPVDIMVNNAGVM